MTDKTFKVGGEVADRVDGRCSFNIAWFKCEDAANRAAKQIRKEGRSHNGGWFHGMPCGRDSAFDMKDKETGETTMFAVSF